MLTLGNTNFVSANCKKKLIDFVLPIERIYNKLEPMLTLGNIKWIHVSSRQNSLGPY